MRRAAALVALVAAAAAAEDPCTEFASCATCIGDVGCGWCSTDIVFEDGSKGAKCAGPATTKPFTCSGIYSTTKCIAGYDCQNNTCQLQPPGQGVDKDSCQKTCTGPAADVYTCDHATKNCSKATPGAPGASSLPICQAACSNGTTPAPAPAAKVYMCNAANFTCVEAAPGTAGAGSKELCMESCKQSFVCDTKTYQCVPGAGKAQTKDQCQQTCKSPGDECSKHYTCQDCLDASSKCGWCSKNVTYVSGEVGTQCAGVAPGILPFQCDGSYSTDACSTPPPKPTPAPKPPAPTPPPPAPTPTHKPDHCSVYGSCTTCIGDVGCGWCSLPVVYADNTTGVHCAGTQGSKFSCPGIYSTEECIAGYKCFVDSNSSVCKLQGPGEGIPRHTCDAKCVGPAHKVYLCNATNKQCHEVPAGTPGSTSLELCKTNCTVAPASVYKCDKSTLTCQVVPVGTPGSASKPVCEESCGLWACDYSGAPNYKCSVGVGNWTQTECQGVCRTPNDPCRAHGDSCGGCLAAGSKGECGWCSVPVVYASGEPGSQCAGVDASILPFKCDGTYSNAKCPP
eukprot:TRINITY_DN11404_c0_g1_i1.p1 TRINITY_DN11404_c0_g1~~TRINITY_DN11404_c0_g1_i1.p1  ORF type:complete len:566 (+),score=159.79 TRINITY_DN11404_c0_g1_i1:84-1781(+)